MIEASEKMHNKPVADSPLTLAEVTGFMAMEVKLQSSLTEQNAKFIKVGLLFSYCSGLVIPQFISLIINIAQGV